MSAESDYADAVSRILLQQGHARALGAMGSGKAWAGFAQQLGDLPGQLYGQYQQMKGFEQDQAARDQQMAIRDSDSKLRQQQAGFEAEDRQRAAEIRRQATDALRGVQGGPAPTSPNALDRNSAGQPSPKAINEASDRAYGQIKSGNTDAVFSQLPPEARVLAEKWYQDFSAGDQARQAQAQAEGKRAAQMIRALNYDPVVAGTAIRLLGDAFPGAKDALGHTTDPKQLRALVDYYATIGDKPPEPYNLPTGAQRRGPDNALLAENPPEPKAPTEAALDVEAQALLAKRASGVQLTPQEAANLQGYQERKRTISDPAAIAATDRQNAGIAAATAQQKRAQDFAQQQAGRAELTTKVEQPYLDAVEKADTLRNVIAAAQNGNMVAGSVQSLLATLGFVTMEGVKRINTTELQQVEGAGSLLERIKGQASKLTIGQPMSQKLQEDLTQLTGVLEQSARKKYEQAHAATVKRYGLTDEQPVPTSRAAAPKTIRARDPQGKLHEAPVGTALPSGWKLEP